MLEVARRKAPIVAERIGYANVGFRPIESDLEIIPARRSLTGAIERPAAKRGAPRLPRVGSLPRRREF
jgi:hypothetical protein